jgi:hypothetical protein
LKTLLKIALIVTAVILGGFASLYYVAPHNLLGHAASPWGLFDLACGSLGGLFLGGMLVTLRG